ncbi:hypothetical protein PDESU_03081 [Pontiella desulfatans]|uniref:DUF1501 domain-containing protein n=1 Tax=Pontiella desulfatans TaxID=2750659 RepID=A0A6C2U3Y1_PONDE|nr:DUF1501 domain-containing protein [Pontiella desulfatans]VGO14519.1 hypothetical protein PDESU_03081 [Pontiella desulfatans]
MNLSRRTILQSAAAAPLLAQAAAAPNAKAKAVIQIWIWGGPAHLDTFDPKPDAGYDYCGAYTKPIATNVDGIRIGEALPELAKQADKFSIIRSMTHGINAHESASYCTQTGRLPGGRIVYPAIGSVVSLKHGYDAGYNGLIPPYVVLTEPQGRFSEAGFLGPRYKPFATGGDPAQNPFAVEGIVAEGITDRRQRERRELLRWLDTFGKRLPGNAQLETYYASKEKAYDLIMGDGAKIFDLSQESDELRERYGRNTFGQSCLAARRLVEAGVKYITINFKGWDTHKKHFEEMRRKLPQMDAGFATLLSDLSDRGLLDSTIVWWGGEFGRTPKIQWEAPWDGGRGHHGACFSHVLAGGGFKGGQVVGASDAKGVEVAERPVRPWDLIGSIHQQMGVDPASTIPHSDGPVSLVPGEIDGYSTGGRLKELI